MRLVGCTSLRSKLEPRQCLREFWKPAREGRTELAERCKPTNAWAQLARPTFDLRGGPKGAKRPLERPLDGRVRRHRLPLHSVRHWRRTQTWPTNTPPLIAALSHCVPSRVRV